MLSTSDNDLAEALAHLVAHAPGEPADFAGGVAAVTNGVEALGLPVQTGSCTTAAGCRRPTRVAPLLLGRLLVLAAVRRPPRAAPAAHRAGGRRLHRQPGPPRSTTRRRSRAAGLVRAKTGTLTGVSALAGTVEDADGRLLAFVFVADRVRPATPSPRATALDRLATAVAGCGCRPEPRRAAWRGGRACPDVR